MLQISTNRSQQAQIVDTSASNQPRYRSVAAAEAGAKRATAWFIFH
jgi:hypothetical protein